MSTRDDPLLQLCATPVQGVATVLVSARGGGPCMLRTSQGELAAQRAASCLLAPEAGDRIWFAGDIEHGLYVTAVLERGDAAAPPRVCLPPGSSIEAAEGALTLRAESLRLESRQLSVRADDVALCAHKLTGVGREAQWSFGRIRVVSDLLESFADRLVQFTRWSQRTVEGIDQVRAGQMDYRAEQLMQLQAQNLVANAANLVKVDGEQIHLG